MPKEPARGESSYIVDAENATEMARLINQDRLTTKSIGGIFPAGFDLSPCHDILDLASGPGGWVMDVAFTYPKLWVTGVDISNLMVEYARAQARVQSLNNARFTVMDITQPLQFPDNSFDIVNARLLTAFLRQQAWPALLQECMRVLRPGGILRITESEWFLTNKVAPAKIGRMLASAMKKAGLGFSPDGENFGITPVLGSLFRNAGFQDIEQQPYSSDFSAGTPVHASSVEDVVIAVGQLPNFLIGMGVTTQEEFDQIYNLLQAEMMQSDFCGLSFLLSVWGKKPA